jgi:hypothetical protein
MFKKIFLLAVLAALAAGLCLGQDLVEAAKKEKERREAQKGGKAVFITNTHLVDLKKKAAVPSQSGGPAPDAAQTLNAPVTAVPGTIRMNAPAGPEPTSPGGGDKEQLQAEYQDRFDKAKEKKDLLELKLLSLRQQLTTFNSMESKEKVQRDFAETYQKFQLSQTEAAKAKEDLDRFLGKDPGKSASPAIR